MITVPQQLIALLPLLLIGLTVMVAMLLIAWKRNHFVNAILSIFGLNAALISLWFVSQTNNVNVTLLIQVDNYSTFYSGLVMIASLSTCVLAYSWLKNYTGNKEEFYLLVLIATLGGILLADANHLASLFLGIELISLPLFGLIGYTFHQSISLEASVKYMILSSAASSFLLFGIALLYTQSGDLSFTMFNQITVDHVSRIPLLSVGMSLMIVGIGFKLSLVPFHLWTPDVYQGAPAPVSVFLATTSKIAIFGATMRLFSQIPDEGNQAIHTVLEIMAFVSIIFGNIMALSQTNIKRLFGYSSISHLGYLLVALISIKRSQISTETIGMYLIGYLLNNLGVFGVISLMSNPFHSQDLDSLFSYRGLFWHRPVLSVAMTIMLFSLAGVPMTLGFIGKLYVLTIGVQSHLWWISAAIVISSAISLYYYLRIAISLYLSTSLQTNGVVCRDRQQYCLGDIIVLLSAFLVLIFGIYPQPLINIIRHTIPPM